MSRFNLSRHVVTGASAVFLTLMLTACGSSSKSSSSPTPTMDQMTVSPDNGLASSVGGYSLVTDVGSINASKPADFTFHITAPGGSVQTSFAEDQTKLMHFYVVRSDVTGYQHLHPAEGSGNQTGMWSGQSCGSCSRPAGRAAPRGTAHTAAPAPRHDCARHPGRAADIQAGRTGRRRPRARHRAVVAKAARGCRCYDGGQNVNTASCGEGSKDDRDYDRACLATATPCWLVPAGSS